MAWSKIKFNLMTLWIVKLGHLQRNSKWFGEKTKKLSSVLDI